MADAEHRIAILGTLGVPARYGGFETLAAELVRAAAARGQAHRLTVWCTSYDLGSARPGTWQGASLRYLPLRANGPQSIAYDALSLLQAARSGHKAALLLGVSGALALPLLRATSSMRIVTHLDGIEWQRQKWGAMARTILKRSEAAAVRWSDAVIADNPEITRHVRESHGRKAIEISYGHEAALGGAPADISDLGLPERYALAIARAEPENNLAAILEAFAALPDTPLVAVSNWQATAHGRDLHARYECLAHMHLLDAVYDRDRLRAIRRGAWLYLHGHSAGGTNPSLVEMMGFSIPVVAWDCTFNRAATEEAAAFFDGPEALRGQVAALADQHRGPAMGAALAAIARRRYRWRDVTDAYFDLLDL